MAAPSMTSCSQRSPARSVTCLRRVVRCPTGWLSAPWCRSRSAARTSTVRSPTGSRAAFNAPQPLVQTVTTNVPGPRVPLYILGRRMEAAYPYVPIGSTLRIAVAIFSYLDTISFGITADYNAVPDLEILIEGIGRGLAELRRQPPAETPRPA